MSYDFKVIHGEHTNHSSYPIGSGDILSLQITDGETLKNMRVVLYDENSQIRFIHRRKHGISLFATEFLQVKSAATWKIVMRAINPEGEAIEIVKSLFVDQVSKKEAPLIEDVVEEEPLIEVDEISKKEDEEVDPTISIPLTILKGVGKVTETKLNDGGILTLKQLATSTLEEVMGTGLTENKSQTFIKRAQDYMNENS